MVRAREWKGKGEAGEGMEFMGDSLHHWLLGAGIVAPGLMAILLFFCAWVKKNKMPECDCK